MNTYDFVQLALYALGGEIKGRTKLQKTIYFLALTTGQDPMELGYRAHFYGPYSEEVAESVDRLKSLGFVDQSIATGGGVDSRGFEMARYDFQLNDEGRQIAKEKWNRLDSKETRRLERATEMFKRGGDMDYVKLSIAAKTFFMLNEKGSPATQTEIAILAKKFGWEVTEQQVSEAFSFLKKLDLAKGT